MKGIVKCFKNKRYQKLIWNSLSFLDLDGSNLDEKCLFCDDYFGKFWCFRRKNVIDGKMARVLGWIKPC